MSCYTATAVILGVLLLRLSFPSLAITQGLTKKEPLCKGDATHRLSTSELPRRLVLDDLLALESVDEVVPSPDGEWFAVTVIRGRTDGEIYGRSLLFGRSRADVWLIPKGSGEIRNLTLGVQEGSGFWSPVWSPDSRRLAVLSTAGGDNIRPYVVNIANGKMERISQRGIDLDLDVGTGDDGRLRRAMAWTSDTTLVFSSLAEGELSRALTRASPHHRFLITPEWEQVERGQAPTASVLEAGIEIGESGRSNRELVSADVNSGTIRVLATGRFSSLRIGDGGFIAVTSATSAVLPHPHRSLSLGNVTAAGVSIPMHGRLGIISSASDRPIHWVEGVLDPEPYDRERAMKWSNDGHWIAVIGKDRVGQDSATTPFIVSMKTGRAERIGPPSFHAFKIVWAGSWLLVHGLSVGTAEETAEWWVWDSRHPNRALRRLDALSHLKQSIWSIGGLHSAVGHADGNLWMIDPAKGTATNITSTFAPDIETVRWPLVPGYQAPRARSSILTLLVAARIGGILREYRLDIQKQGHTLSATEMARPEDGAYISAYASRTNTVAFLLQGPNGTFLWTGSAEGEPSYHRRLALNEHLARIGEGKRVTITYFNGDGKQLTGMLVLPVDYSEGRRYPVITRVYPGQIIGEDGHRAGRKEFPDPQHNVQLFAACGYAVLFPSIPFPGGFDAIDPIFEISKHVLPAVDRVIALGVGDPDRLVLYGHSYGSYAALILLSQTRRFRSAAISSVYSDLFSLYTQFDFTDRYLRFPHELQQRVMGELEGPHTLRMRATPWRDHQQYLRNSPTSYLARIQTPLLLLHGELDQGGPLTQAEAVFTGLYRLGARTRFVRYWGEGHNLDSPANIRDLWQQVLRWFDAYLEPNE